MSSSETDKVKRYSEMSDKERIEFAKEVRGRLAHLVNENNYVKKTGDYKVLVDNKWKSKSYTIYAPEDKVAEMGKAIKSYFAYLSRSETGYKGMKGFAQSKDKLYIVYHTNKLGSKEIADPARDRFGEKAHVILFSQEALKKSANHVELYSMNDPGKIVGYADACRAFIHEFGHVLQHSGNFPEYYSHNKKFLLSEDAGNLLHRTKEAHATRFVNDVYYENGAQHFRKNYQQLDPILPGSIGRFFAWLERKSVNDVDAPDRIRARQPENVVDYKAVQNKKEYLTLQQIRTLRPKNGAQYKLKDSAEGILVFAQNSEGENKMVRLYHYTDIKARQEKSELENIRKEFSDKFDKDAEKARQATQKQDKTSDRESSPQPER